ncbi:MAG TPA: hypothetical protein VGM92_08000 [Candidatus Kapabacteria bacterium]|jgi:hypothetical protein
MYDSDSIDSVSYDDQSTRSTTLRRFRHRQFIFTFLFLIGTLIAAAGWYAEWRNLLSVPFDRWLALAGHLLQVAGVFGSLLTPDYIENDGE